MKYIYTGKTVEEAIETGLQELGIEKEKAHITVIDEGKKGVFGIGAKPAQVEIEVKKGCVEDAVSFLEGLFDVLKITATAEVESNSKNDVVINLTATDSSQLIGYRGEVLDAIQCLASAVYNCGKEKYERLVVDCENYREKREKTLKDLAIKLADKAKNSCRKIILEPMNPFERRVIHSTLMDVEGVTTMSEGKEPNRFVAIIPDGYDPTQEAERYEKNNRKYEKKHSKKTGGKFNKPQQRTQKKTFGSAVFLGNSLKNQTEDKE